MTDNAEASSTVATRNIERELEAVLMVADQPQGVMELSSALDIPVAHVKKAIAHLVSDFNGLLDGPERGFELREVGGGWRIYVRESYDHVVARVVHDQTPAKLSSAALETLAVIAYKQPVTRGQVSAIRAVNVDSVMRTLANRGLIRESHTDPETGAIFYVTTELLLVELGIESIEQLPPLSPLLDDGAEGFDDVS
jgi:segregation and condensation protein B